MQRNENLVGFAESIISNITNEIIKCKIHNFGSGYRECTKEDLVMAINIHFGLYKWESRLMQTLVI